MTAPESPFRDAERKFGDDRDALWAWLEDNKHSHPTVAIGWAIERARRYLNLDQAAVAERTAVYRDGQLIEPAISKSFVSAMLSARSRVSPEVYRRLAAATDVNVIHFHIAEGWEDEADVASYHFADQEVAHPIITRILRLPRDTRPRAVGVVTATLDSIQSIRDGIGSD